MFVYQVDIYCDDCGKRLMAELPKPEGYGAVNESSYDSDDYPKGPFPIEEADTPEHCASCHEFLANPLTADGEVYVREFVQRGDGNPEVLAEWRKEYAYLFEEAQNE